MALLRSRTGFDGTKWFQAILFSFIAVQILSFILHVAFDFPLLKGGWILLLFLLTIFIVVLFVTGRKLGQLKKQDWIFFGLVVLILIVSFFILPKIIPQIFSTQSLELRDSLYSIIGG